MGYITERAFVILLLFSFASSTASLLLGRSGLQLRARIQVGFVEAFFSTTLGFSQRLSQITLHFKNIQLWISCFVFTTILHSSWISSGSSLRGFWFFASLMHTLFSVFFTGRAMIIASFLEQKFWVVASWMINLVYRDHDWWFLSWVEKNYFNSKIGGVKGFRVQGFLVQSTICSWWWACMTATNNMSTWGFLFSTQT